MDFIIFGSTIFIILIIIKLYKKYKPNIDIIINDDNKSIVLWYSTYDEDLWEIRHHKTLITF